MYCDLYVIVKIRMYVNFILVLNVYRDESSIQNITQRYVLSEWSFFL